jgi:hypothetical protein
LQCLLKHSFHEWSARNGGVSSHDTLRLVWERWFMRTHILVLHSLQSTPLVPALADELRTQSTLPALLSL